MNLTALVLQTIFWVLGFLFLIRVPRCPGTKKKVHNFPSVSVIIPTRNEEHRLPVLLSSLQRQSLVPDEILVIDESNDRTAEIACSMGATVIRCKTRPEDWLGKSWACYQGAGLAQGEILVFLDADTFLETNGLHNIVGTCIEKGNAVITVLPYHYTEKAYEQLSAFFNIIMVGAMGTFTILGELIKPLGLSGPCIALSKELYLRSGGHFEVRNNLAEDLAWGERLKKMNIPVYCYGGKGSISYRMYPQGIGQLIEGWSKNIAAGAVKTYIPLLLIIIAWIGGCIGATEYFIKALFHPDTVLSMLSIAVYFAFAFQLYWMFSRAGNFKLSTAIIYPVPLLFFLLVFVYSFFQIFILKRVKWKGTTISLRNRGNKE